MSPPRPLLRFGLLAVGDELLAGDVTDTNTPWLARRVAAAGHVVAGAATVPDDVAAISRAVERFRDECDVLIVTGGLGPTLDDLTRDGVAAALGRRLVIDPEVLADLGRVYGERLAELGARQAEFPRGARVLPNPAGTAPGFLLRYGILDGEEGGFSVACLPGVPSEMTALAERLFGRAFGPGSGVPTRRVHACGLPESEVGARLADLMAEPDEGCRVGVTVSKAVVTVSIRGSDAAAVERAEGVVVARLGRHVFAAGEAASVHGSSLASVVVALLAERGMTVATAESCTGGLLAGAITSVPGSSAVFREGVVAYADAVKTARLGVPPGLLAAHGAVSVPVAAAMARGARAATGADVALSITGVAGPGGGSPDKPVGLVVFGLDAASGASTLERRWRGTRDEIRERSVSAALDLLRRHLLG